MADLLQVSGARGASFAEIARRTGVFGTLPTDSDIEVQQKFANYAIQENPGFQSTIPGPADNTYFTLATFKASDTSRKTASLVGIPNVPDGRFNWTPGNFTGQADDINIIKADSTSLTVGAWARQKADGVAFVGSIPGSLTQGLGFKAAQVKAVTDTGADLNSRYVSEDSPDAPPIGIDSTPAFRAALLSSTAYTRTPLIEASVDVPTGRYRLDGDTAALNIHKGAHLRGNGYGSYLDASKNGANTRVYLGGGDAGRDPGGSPTGISGFRTFGGSATGKPFILTDTAGFFISEMFMTSPGTAIGIIGQSSSEPATDGIVSDVEIDQASLAFDIAKAQNLTISNANLYESATVFRIGSDTRDMAVSNVLAAYSDQVVFFNESADRIRNLTFANVVATSNIQRPSYTAFAYSRANNVQALFTGFSIANAPGWFSKQEAGFGNDLAFVGGVVSGERSTTAYTQGTTSKGLATGFLGRYLLEATSFLNLRGEALTVNGSLTRLTVRGGRRVMMGDALAQFLALPETTPAQVMAKYGPLTGIVINSTDRVVPISIKGMDGLGFAYSNSTHQYFVLPFWGYNTEYRIHVRGNLARGSSTTYGGWENFILSVRTGAAASVATQWVEKINPQRPATRDGVPDMSADVCFGAAPGGATTRTGSDIAAAGFICLSVPAPTATAGDFEWTAETLN